MKVVFSEKDPKKVLAAIQNAMGGRKLGDLVKFDVKAGQLTVTISKLGTSVFTFKEKQSDKGLEYFLESEKIAFTHKPMKDDVTQKIVKVIEQAGGVVS